MAVPLSLFSKAGRPEAAGDGQGASSPSTAPQRGARRRDEHPGLLRVLAHVSPCGGAERASLSHHLRAGHAAGSGSGTGFRQEQVGHGMRLGTGSSAHGERRCSCCHRHLDSCGRKSLAEPAETKAEGTRHGSGTWGFHSFLSVQFFSFLQAGTAAG